MGRGVHTVGVLQYALGDLTGLLSLGDVEWVVDVVYPVPDRLYECLCGARVGLHSLL